MLRVARVTLQTVGLFTILASITCILAFFDLANLLQYENRPEKADFIFPLAGDMQRLTKAAQLYREGFASKILLSNEIAQRPITVATISDTQSDALALYLNALAASGVSPSDIMQFGENLASTAEEAEALQAFLGNRPATVLLVTSPYEALRAKIIFERALPSVKWLVICADQSRLPEQWWRDKTASLTVVTEVAKITYYLAGGIFRGPKSTDLRRTTQRESSSDLTD